MPQQQMLPTWVALNNANFTSQSGMSDPITGQPYNAGGLNAGDYFDLTNAEALQNSYLTNGTLFEGRYRLVLVDSGATAANVKTGTVGYMRAGSVVKRVQILTAGSGQTNGTYTVSATAGSGGGSGAQISVTISGGAVTAVSVLNGGFGYVSAPTFTIAQGGTPGTVVAQLDCSVNIVTSADVALGANAALAGVGAVRPVIFLNSITPGNYGFIQELGVATVIAAASQSQTVNQFAIVKSSGPDGTMTASSATFGAFTIGNVIDPLTTPPAGTGFKILLDGPVVQG